MTKRTSSRSAGADALLGALAGAFAVWVMDRVDWFNFQHEAPEVRRRTQMVRPGAMDPAHVLAHHVSEASGINFGSKEHNPAGIAAHYAIGIAPAILYGVLRHEVPGLRAGRGALFGMGLFLAQDEGVNKLAKLSAKPDQYPWQAHARGLVAHAVYGLALDAALNMADTLRIEKRQR